MFICGFRGAAGLLAVSSVSTLYAKLSPTTAVCRHIFSAIKKPDCISQEVAKYTESSDQLSDPIFSNFFLINKTICKVIKLSI